MVPRGQELQKKLEIPFDQPGGIRVSDVGGIVSSESAQAFIKAVTENSLNDEDHSNKTEILLQFGKLSMDFWNQFYEEADPELQQILTESNFNPCREPKQSIRQLHDGYRIDLIYNIENAKIKAEAMAKDYQRLGYQYCALLTPAEVKALDPSLTRFCEMHSEIYEGEEHWKNDAIALWRPGGCIDTQTFLPKFFTYLENKLGNYVNSAQKSKKCLQIHYQRQVTSAKIENNRIQGLGFFGQTELKYNKHAYPESNFEFFPGENVGTLNQLGFNEPTYAGFAGPSLCLKIPLTQEDLDSMATYAGLNHCMEVHQEGVVLAWQARIVDQCLVIRVAGTKAFYGDQKPHNDHAFALNRHLLQLNIINNVLPEALSKALGRGDNQGKNLTFEDLRCLEEKGIAVRWVGTRAVAHDGLPTVGPLYSKKEKQPIQNGWTATHFGSGGVSFALGGVHALAAAQETNHSQENNACLASVLRFGTPNRS